MANLSSDTAAAIHPAVLEAICKANQGYAPAYGNDQPSAELTLRLRQVFAHDALLAFPVFNGSAANATALASLIRPYQSAIAHAQSHLVQSECGMNELFSGGTLALVGGAGGKLSASEIGAHLRFALGHVPHSPRPAALSFAQSTEAGTVYQPQEIRALAALVKPHGLRLHMDGARLGNAVARLGCTPAEITWQAGVDVLSLGGTKNGAMLAEAVVFFDPALADDFVYIRKRAGQLPTKQRYMAAQFLALLADDLWLKNAAHANAMADRLAAGMRTAGLRLLMPVEANAVFAELPTALAARLRQRGHVFYNWPTFGENAYRLITSFSTTAAEIDQFLADCKAL